MNLPAIKGEMDEYAKGLLYQIIPNTSFSNVCYTYRISNKLAGSVYKIALNDALPEELKEWLKTIEFCHIKRQHYAMKQILDFRFSAPKIKAVYNRLKPLFDDPVSDIDNMYDIFEDYIFKMLRDWEVFTNDFTEDEVRYLDTLYPDECIIDGQPVIHLLPQDVGYPPGLTANEYLLLILRDPEKWFTNQMSAMQQAMEDLQQRKQNNGTNGGCNTNQSGAASSSGGAEDQNHNKEDRERPKKNPPQNQQGGQNGQNGQSGQQNGQDDQGMGTQQQNQQAAANTQAQDWEDAKSSNNDKTSGGANSSSNRKDSKNSQDKNSNGGASDSGSSSPDDRSDQIDSSSGGSENDDSSSENESGNDKSSGGSSSSDSADADADGEQQSGGSGTSDDTDAGDDSESRDTSSGGTEDNNEDDGSDNSGKPNGSSARQDDAEDGDGQDSEASNSGSASDQDGSSSSGDEGGTDENEESTPPRELTKEELDELIKQFIQKAVSDYQKSIEIRDEQQADSNTLKGYSRDGGGGGANGTVLVDKCTNWIDFEGLEEKIRELMINRCVTTTKRDLLYNYNRGRGCGDVLTPRYREQTTYDEVPITVVLDVSGSISDKNILGFCNIFKNVSKTCGKKCRIVMWDTGLRAVYDSNDDIKAVSGGGTDIGRGIQYVKDNFQPAEIGNLFVVSDCEDSLEDWSLDGFDQPYLVCWSSMDVIKHYTGSLFNDFVDSFEKILVKKD